MISDAFSSFEIGHFYIPAILNIFFVCMYSVYILMNRYVERKKAQESYIPLSCLRFTARVYFIVVMYCHKPFISILDFVLLFFGSESMLTTQIKVFLSSSWLSFAALDDFPSRITNLCIP